MKPEFGERSIGMKKTIAVFLISASACVVLLQECGADKPVSISGPPPGNCVGTIRDATGALVVGARVMLVPEQYCRQAAGDASAGGPDSTVTNDKGQYGFSVTTPGRYNLLAKKYNLFSMRQAVPISSHIGVELGDTLHEAGSISGTIHLQGKSNHRPAIILFIGTNFCTTPSHTVGNFSVAALAQGFYALRILTTEPDFSVKETTVAVVSGAHTRLPVIELAKTTVSLSDSLFTDYDPAVMTVTLRWKPRDTALINGYSIYCNRAKTMTPLLTVNKSCSTHTIDLAFSPVDTLCYQVTAIGRDGVEGPPLLGRNFVRTPRLTLIKTIRYQKLDFRDVPNGLFVDRRENIYLVGSLDIFRLDTSGAVKARLSLPSGEPGYFTGTIQGDDSGNLYIGKYDRLGNSFIIRYDSEFHVLSELPLPTFDYTFAVSGQGSILVLYRDKIAPGGWSVDVYDSSLTRMSTAPAAHGRDAIDRAVNFNDTLVTVEHASPGPYNIVYRDNSLATKGYVGNFDFLNDYAPSNFNFTYFSVLGPHGLFGAHFMSDEPIEEDVRHLLVFCAGKTAICRLPDVQFGNIRYDRMAFDTSGKLYALGNGGEPEIHQFSIELYFKGR
jgi:hypothetical protein